MKSEKVGESLPASIYELTDFDQGVNFCRWPYTMAVDIPKAPKSNYVRLSRGQIIIKI